MKALTLIQPWATLIAIGAKKIETRSWYTDYRGPLAIHAGKNKEFLYLCGMDPFNLVGHSASLPMGAMVATCELVHVKRINAMTSFVACKEYWWNKKGWMLDRNERAFGDFTEGRYMWLLTNIKMLPEPIPAKGAQGLWNWEES